MDQTQQAWEAVAGKYEDESDEILAFALSEQALWPAEREVLAEILAAAPAVVHPQSGDGADDIALARAGARSVLGVDYSPRAVAAAQRRADQAGLPVRYLVGTLPGLPVEDGDYDLVYTGKGALIWMRDLDAWARDLHRVLRPGGHLFIYEGHPAVPLWTWDTDEPRIRPDRSYFTRSFVNDTFPANGAVETQWTLGEIVTTLIRAGFTIRHLAEYAEPFWRWGDLRAAAWEGRLPNAFSLLAER
ncbi:SAM-dependent methyltransferase [Actinoplanes octamycinicus]|uniref:SAM-dependent methyltransferase n=1 Tax=Actinoplanes octamycinicus TaxID=135948 RepID=A0A7W7H5K8_9ACTN|nr:class I SAM-dependent methyltransferase [Actinoplanes octamycinicus]MBB4744416.1 SAM-dependent methyltransferase [Actinoplanes octamycinicus]GIE56624.1 methyltransferase [Actinoplanes octamycinicus]